MAQVQQSPVNPPPSATNGQPSLSSSSSPQTAPISWEGDRMFNVYIHDYFLKRGFRKAAKELVQEAEIGNDASPPINARQGFLFEWWSVFWMFFSAKTTGQGPENVMLYFHWIQTQQAERNRHLQHENEQRRVAAQLPLPTQPPTARAIARPPPNGIRPPAMVNGTVPVPMPQAPGQSASTAQALQYTMGVPHGAMPTHQQAPPGSGQQPSSQINGIVDPSPPHGHALVNPQRPPSQQQQNRPGPHTALPQQQQPQVHPPPSHPSALPHLQSSQRQLPRGQHDTMRHPGQFGSPNMASAHPPGTVQQGPLGHAHMPGMGGPMLSMGAPAAHLSRAPQPQPGGPPATASPRNPSQTTAQSYPQTMGPPQGPGSRSATPGGSLLPQHSPGLAAREPPPQGQIQSVNDELNRRFQQQQQQQHHQQQQQQQQLQQQRQQQQQQRPNPPDQQDLSNMEQNLARIPPVFLAQMKQEAGVNDRDISTLSYDEKSRLNEVFKKTMATYNGTAGAANQARRAGLNQPTIPGMPMGPPQGPQSRQPSGQRGQKRASTSPSDDQGGDSTPKDQSPPDRKRQRQSPQGGVGQAPGGTDAAVAPPPMGSIGGFPPSHPGSHPGGYAGPAVTQHQQNLPNGFPRPQMGGGPMNPHTGQPVPNVGGINMGAINPAGMGHPMAHMNPALANQHVHQMPNSQVGGASGRPPLPSPEMSYPFQNQSQQIQQQQMHYRQAMAAQHLQKIPGGIPGGIPGAPNPANLNPSPSSDQHDVGARAVQGAGAGAGGGPAGVGIGVGHRPPPQGKPGSMMPPPSPAHRAESVNVVQKGAGGMMPPPAQPGSAPGSGAQGSGGGGGGSKEQTAPSPAGAGRPHDAGSAATGSSPSMRPASRSGAGSTGGNNAGSVPAMSQNGPGGPGGAPVGGGGGPQGPATPVSGGNGGNGTAPSPSSVLTNRISPSAAMSSLPRPQTSGADGSNAGSSVPASGAAPTPQQQQQQAQAAQQQQQQQQPPPPPPPSSGASAAAGLPSNLFGDFFDTMEDGFGLDSLESLDPTEFSQWIDMNPLS